ncbi:hypothetical protein ROZALSC1DRAFT_26641 [Rozella allomycis CSF55]|uniref:Uncharacterized protein n=1 Tax=Rozella allomycis (strain CSF55) TaxID=988480 RepID=A0A4P9YQM5_ROZAC|nr:hypothetical protein ROZALSC1DRAFT_26641 [Rozella allomycis CSF55]
MYLAWEKNLELYTTMSLPKLFTCKPESVKRMTFNENNELVVMYREWMQECINTSVERLNQSPKNILALTGPIGKSYCLFLLSVVLKQTPTVNDRGMKFEVLYLPSFIILTENSDILLKEMEDSFGPWAREIISKQHKNKKPLSRFFNDLNVAASEAKVRLVLIVDQLNSIYNYPHQREVESFLKYNYNRISIFVSFSANCNIETKEPYYKLYDAVNFEIKETEARSFIETVAANLANTLTDLDIAHIIDTTGGFPIDVANLVRSKGNLKENIMNFRLASYRLYNEDLR